MAENRWEPFTDDEVAHLFDAVGECPVIPDSPERQIADALYDELRAELTRRRPDDERLLTVLGGTPDES